jgi:hypothetical protein
MLLASCGLALILHRHESLLLQRSRLRWQVEGYGGRVTSASSCVAGLVGSRCECRVIGMTFSTVATPGVVPAAGAEPSSSALEAATSGASSTMLPVPIPCQCCFHGDLLHCLSRDDHYDRGGNHGAVPGNHSAQSSRSSPPPGSWCCSKGSPTALMVCVAVVHVVRSCGVNERESNAGSRCDVRGSMVSNGCPSPSKQGHQAWRWPVPHA